MQESWTAQSCNERLQAIRDKVMMFAEDNPATSELPNPSQESSEIRFRAIFDNALDGILLLDNRGLYIDANPSACAIFGRVREHLIGVPLTFNCEFVEWDRFLEEGSARGELKIRRPDGSALQIVLIRIGLTWNSTPIAASVRPDLPSSPNQLQTS